MHNDEWIEKQIAYRFLGIRKTRFALLPRHENFNTNIKSLAILFPNEKRYSKLNAVNKDCFFNIEKNCFETKPNAINRHIRNKQFANLVVSWGFNSPYLTNWEDSQGWDYTDTTPELENLPIMQFSRRKSLRGRVVLFPLGPSYMGAGGKNIPINFDNQNFLTKNDALVWRGRFTGVLTDSFHKLVWAISLIKREDQAEKMKAYYERMPRYQILKSMQSVPWADLGFTLTSDEINNVKKTKWKEEFLFPFVKSNLSISEQINNKFILAIPGNDYPSSLYWSLLSNSVVFLLENDWETVLDSGLKAWIHYVPVRPCKDDIMNKFEKMVNEPNLCLEIIQNAHEYMKPFLDKELRDAVDYETLRYYQDSIIPIAGLSDRWSFSKAKG